MVWPPQRCLHQPVPWLSPPAAAVLAHPMVRALVDYIDGNAECTKWRLKHEDYVVYDLARALSLRDLFSRPGGLFRVGESDGSI